MARRSPLTSIFALALVGAGAWVFSGPYRAFADLRTAARAGDQQALEELVDFPAFRSSVKDAVGTSVRRGINGGEQGGVLGALGGMIAGAVASPVVDQVVTPSGIAALTQGARPGESRGDDANGQPTRRRDDQVRVRRGYENLSTFVVRLHDADTDHELVALVMRREGLDWRLAQVRLPDPKPAQAEDEQ